MSANGSSKPSETDWARIDAMKDEDIDFSDTPELTDKWFAKAKLVMPKGQQSQAEVRVSVEPKVAAWYDAQGQDRDRRLRAALRLYADAHAD